MNYHYSKYNENRVKTGLSDSEKQRSRGGISQEYQSDYYQETPPNLRINGIPDETPIQRPYYPEKDIKPQQNNTLNQYEEQTAVSDEASNNPYDTSLQSENRNMEMPSPGRQHSPEEIRKNDQLLSLLVGGAEETKAQKRERQK